MSAPPPGRFAAYEIEPGRYGVFDRKRSAHFPYEWMSPIEAILEARKMTINAVKEKTELMLIEDGPEPEGSKDWTELKASQ